MRKHSVILQQGAENSMIRPAPFAAVAAQNSNSIRKPPSYGWRARSFDSTLKRKSERRN